MKKLLILAVLFTATNAMACHPNDRDCLAGTTNKAGHVLDVYMGGYSDYLYVCEIEVLGHQCDDRDVKKEGDYLTTKNSSGPTFQNLVQSTNEGKGKKIVINYNQWKHINGTTTAPGHSGNVKAFYTQLHLNSFKYGSEYKVTYCFDWKRQTTEGDSGFNYLGNYGYDQAGRLAAHMRLKINTFDYWNDADTKVKMGWSCEDGRQENSGHISGWKDVSSAGIHYDWNEMIPLDYDAEGQCRFTFHFKEGKVGQLRPYRPDTLKSWIKTSVEANMNLINIGGPYVN